MQSVSTDMDAERLPSLNGEINQSDISADLTGAGLLVERVERMACLYAEHRSWAAVRDTWHGKRVSRRGSRGSAQKIYRILQRRLQEGGSSLPSVPRLAGILDACRGKRAKAQVTYLYLVHADMLVKYVLHQILQQSGQAANSWDLSGEALLDILQRFRDAEGQPLKYADSTRERWVQGFRSVLHDIGVRERPYDEEGYVPTLEREALLVAAGYSWSEQGEGWQQNPLGIRYLFQSPHHWATLFDRVQRESEWVSRGFQNRVLLRPRNSPFEFEL